MTSGPRRAKEKCSDAGDKCCMTQNDKPKSLLRKDSQENVKRNAILHLSSQPEAKKKCPMSPCPKGSECPGRSSELYVSQIPKTIKKNEMMELFRSVGEIHEFRLMMETDELNQGFAFVKYKNHCDAEKAIETFNNYEIRESVSICVNKSVENNRIFVGNIPKGFIEEDIYINLSNVTPGVSKVILYPSINDRSRNRGYGFIEYGSHLEAASARQKLMSDPPVWLGHEVKVDWAEPELKVNEDIMNKVKILYVRNLALATTEQQLLDLFGSLGGEVERVRKLKDYAFIHYATREQAEKAKEQLQGKLLDGCEMDISWSKPVTNREEYQRRKAMSKFMLSRASPSPASLTTAINAQGDPIYLSPRIRNAAGAQGFTSPKPFTFRPKPTEVLLQTISQQNGLLPSAPFQNVAPVKYEFGIVPSIPPLYAVERPPSPENAVIAQEDEMQLHLGEGNQQNLIIPPQYNSPVWPQQQFVVPQQLSYSYLPAGQTMPYVYPSYTSPAYMNNNYYGQFGCSQYVQHPVMTHITNINGSSMSFEDHRKNI